MGKGKGHVPVRTCVSCMAKRRKQDLARFVLNAEGRLIFDEASSMKGRGVYTCKTGNCMDGLKNGRKILRAFQRLSTKGSGRGSAEQGRIGGFNGKS
ncbi:MAG: DUF448 domain-containing protein [Deltaproteobacteria bacterium]|nr:DUF448 domain-containing protein [Deltaproteobacteria bacterium]